VAIELGQTGFAPLGGGEITATIQPFVRRAGTTPFNLSERGDLVAIKLVASNLNLDHDICKRELSSATACLLEAGIDDALITSKCAKLTGIGEGNTCYAVVEHQVKGTGNATPTTNASHNTDEIHREVFSLLGEKRTSAENMGNRLAGMAKRYLLDSDALVDEYLTDQLLLPLTLAGGGEFTARTISAHTETQAWLIQQFLPVDIQISPINANKSLIKVIS